MNDHAEFSALAVIRWAVSYERIQKMQRVREFFNLERPKTKNAEKQRLLFSGNFLLALLRSLRPNSMRSKASGIVSNFLFGKFGLFTQHEQWAPASRSLLRLR